jgi:hypothetical protein
MSASFARTSSCRKASRKVDACDRNGAGGFINRSIPSLPVCELYERSNPKGRMYLVGRVGTLKLLVIETVDRSKVEKVWQAYFGQGHTPRRGRRRWCVRLSSSRIASMTR